MKSTCYILFSLLTLIFLVTTAYSAELGAGKALKADKGPTLEQTMDFINNKLRELHVDSLEHAYEGNRAIYNYKAIDFSSDGCSVHMKRKSQYIFTASDSPGYTQRTTSEDIFDFNLSEVSTVTVDLFGKQYAENSNDAFTRGGNPLFAVVIKEPMKHIKINTIFNNSSPSSSMVDVLEIPTKSKENATRLTNAFEHAVQLCGGGKEIKKEELF